MRSNKVFMLKAVAQNAEVISVVAPNLARDPDLALAALVF